VTSVLLLLENLVGMTASSMFSNVSLMQTDSQNSRDSWEDACALTSTAGFPTQGRPTANGERDAGTACE